MSSFNFPLFSVVVAILLAYLPHFLRVGTLLRQKKYDNTSPRAHAEQHASLDDEKQGYLARLAGAHNNQLETLGVYAAGVVAVVAMGEGDETTLEVFAALYLISRLAYVAAYAGKQVAGGFLRTGCFVVSMVSVIAIWLKAAF